MSLHAELLVRALPDGPIHFIRPDLEGEGQCGRRAGLDEVRLPLDALPFDLESVWDAPRVGDGERDGACRDRGLRQLHLPLGELGGHRRGGARGSVRGGRCKCEDRKSTRLNSSHSQTSYAVFCLTKQTKGWSSALAQPMTLRRAVS